MKKRADDSPLTETPPHSWRNALLCATLMSACVLVARPFADIGFIDDWSYAKTAQIFAQTGHFVYNGWAAAMLGWQVLWGALFIKLFGFSFDVVHLSTLPLAFISVVLFHQILVRCGITPRNAVLGTLTLALSPIFLVLTPSYMSDIPGLLAILVCLYMCLRAIQASSDWATISWLAGAAAVNVVGGTARQIAWLGALVMVPGTAWLLHRRKAVLPLGIALWIVSTAAIFLCMHWFQQQPYSLPERQLPSAIYFSTIRHFVPQVIRATFCYLMLALPVLAAWLPRVRKWPLRRRVEFAAILLVAMVFWISRPADDGFHSWMMPWSPHVFAEIDGVTSIFLLGNNPAALGFWPRALVSLVVLAASMATVAEILRSRRFAVVAGGAGAEGATFIGWRSLLWLTVPTSLAYLALLLPRGVVADIFDRYFLPLLAIAILLMLRYYQDHVEIRLPAVCWWVMVIIGLYSLAGLHDIFALQRARAIAGDELRAAGISRTSITGGLEIDGLTQIEVGGYIHHPWIEIPPRASEPRQNESNFSDECSFWFYPMIPAVVPTYYIATSPLPCLAPSVFPPVTYSAWLPPFHRELYIQQRK